MIDHVLGRPSVKFRRLQVLAVLLVWALALFRGHRHGPLGARSLSRFLSSRLTAWQTLLITLISAYTARNFSTLVGLAAPEPLASMYDSSYFRATWVMTALDAGFWTAMRIRSAWMRELASIAFTVYYLFAADRADEKVRKVRGRLTVEHLRVSWNKSTTPCLSFLGRLLRPRFTRWPPRAIRIPRPAGSDYTDPVAAWLYFDGPLADLHYNKNIILDVPGGGFVSMNPRCHDDRLLAWAGKTGLPVLSLDYKKAPEHPYPYALNECFDVFATIVNTRGRCVGLSGAVVPHIVVVGDSAGGNLATAMTLMIIERNVADASGAGRPPGIASASLPLPVGLVLCYPTLDVNIGNWMTDEQMSLIRDRSMRGTNKLIVGRKSREYTDLVGTPHHSDDEDAGNGQPSAVAAPSPVGAGERSPHPEYSHGGPMTPCQDTGPFTWTSSVKMQAGSTSYRPQALRTRLATSSMISYFNDRVLTPEMMRAMIILYIGPHNRPDFSQDYLLSPVLAPEYLLERFPKTYFLTGERDPLVDDTAIFAGRLRRAKEAVHRRRLKAQQGLRLNVNDPQSSQASTTAGWPKFDHKDAVEVTLIPGISHGFLQVPSLYPPAWKLLSTCAGWMVDMFASADAVQGQDLRVRTYREREGEKERMRSKAENDKRGDDDPSATSAVSGNRNGFNGIHIRAESSGDEDRPLEIGMTRLQKARALGAGNSSDSSESREAEKQAETDAVSGRRRVSKRRGNGQAAKRKGLENLKLKSSDDLLGRRMQGLTGGLTGRPESP